MDTIDAGYTPTGGCFYTTGGYMKEPTWSTAGKRYWNECTLNMNAGFGSKVRPFSQAILFILKY